MSWQSTPLRGFRISARRAGSSPKATAGASSASRCGSRGELDRGFEPLAMGQRRAVRGRDLADLARNDLQAAAVERAAERHRHGPRAVPAQLHDGRLVAGDVERGGKSRGRGAGVKDEIAIGRRGVGRRELQAERPGQLLARRIDVDERHLRAFDPRAEKSDQRADHARADHRDAPGRTRRGVPGRIERGLHIGGQHRARQRNVAGHRHHGLGRQVELGLMGMQRKDVAADQRRRPGLDLADRGVAIFHRERESCRP